MRYSQPFVVACSVFAAAGLAVSTAPAQGDLDEDGFGFFYDSLSPYGDWINISGHGPCWRPDVEEGWAPYTDGYWAYTDVGWTWVSHEPFGSIVYHYGRWLLSNRGWCWVPGADWSPAWVSWRTGGDYIGWAPLPPEVPWHPQRGISTWVDVHTEIGPAYYRFCSVRDFGAPVLTSVLFRPSRNISIMLRTENVTYITVRNSNVFCGGPRYDWVAASVPGGVPLLRVAREENVRHYRSLQGSSGGVQNFVHNNILVLPAPKRVDCSQAARNFSAPTLNVSISKGWYSDPSGNERLRTHFNNEWEQRRTTQKAPGSPRDPSGPDVPLTAPSAAEKKAALNEMAAVQPAPGAGGPRRPGSFTGSGEPAVVPKAQPLQPATPLKTAQPGQLLQPGQPGQARPGVLQRSESGANGAALDSTAERSSSRQPLQGGVVTGESFSGGRGGQTGLRPDSVPRTLPRSATGEPAEPAPIPGAQMRQTSPFGQTTRGLPVQQGAESDLRTQPRPGNSKGVATGMSSGSTLRPSGESPSGFAQPQSSRPGAGFSQPAPAPSGASGVSSRVGGLQEIPPGGAMNRVGPGFAPVQAGPQPRPASAAPMADQSARFPRSGTSQSPPQQQPSSGGVGVGGGGIPGGSRPQSAPSAGSATPPSAPAASPGTAQKKKPGDPGYVPGSP